MPMKWFNNWDRVRIKHDIYTYAWKVYSWELWVVSNNILWCHIINLDKGITAYIIIDYLELDTKTFKFIT